ISRFAWVGCKRVVPIWRFIMKKERFNTYLDEELSKKMTAAMEMSDVGSASEFTVTQLSSMSDMF
ncbi:MAG: hypothetical protein IJI19_04755, partial [Ruminococcus sp.]|nr:hypothetical protein [Ruminococcus sp.]